jgi:two-component system nitrogen regulation sensor histidine kinase NtrY
MASSEGRDPLRVPGWRARRGSSRLSFETRLALRMAWLVLLAALAGAGLAWLWHSPWLLRLGIAAAMLLALVTLMRSSFHQVVRPLQTLSNVVSAMRENEYSFRSREIQEGDALGDLAAHINALSGDLRKRRHRETETFALLERVVETMDVPVFAFDDGGRLQLTNPAAARMLGAPIESMLGTDAASLGVAGVLRAADKGVVSLTGAAGETRWMVRRSKFYQNAIPHTLLLLSDVGGVLREQERQAWQRLIRVMAHEVNNSLTPIKSIAGSLRMTLQRSGASAGRPNPVDMEHGLAIIDERAESLNRFLQGYSQLAKLPPPALAAFDVYPLLERVCSLEVRVPVALTAERNVAISADSAQLEQALINLIRNAADAAMQTSAQRPPEVHVTLHREPGVALIEVEDNGPGITNPANLFIPFYTTKPGGTGIGLVLSMQIVEAHGGTLTLTNRANAAGCCAQIRIPTETGRTGAPV